MIDTPMILSAAAEPKSHLADVGPVRYIVITEPHGDHWIGASLFDAPLTPTS